MPITSTLMRVAIRARSRWRRWRLPRSRWRSTWRRGSGSGEVPPSQAYNTPQKGFERMKYVSEMKQSKSPRPSALSIRMRARFVQPKD
eukprot:6997553-Pyramimonas_sp.AAC.1